MTARILVVDDAESHVKLLEALLLREYYEVVTACNGAEAIEICLGGQIDVVILDVLLPGTDGFEVCRRLKDDPRTTNISVVILTMLDSAEDKIRGLEAGADDFMSKPVKDLQLLSASRALPGSRWFPTNCSSAPEQLPTRRWKRCLSPSSPVVLGRRGCRTHSRC